ncbi:MAG: hypothetical protein K2I79_04050 [Clostridia bacterium]|nr:hypothetical protein [Clostridia bacterium]
MDAKVMRRLGRHIKDGEEDLLRAISLSAPKEECGCGIDNVREYSYDNNFDPIAYYTPLEDSEKYNITVKLDGVYSVNRVRIVENTAFSQRIENFEIYACCDGKRKKVYDGTVVGYNRMALFRAVKCDSLEIVITSSRKKPYIEFIGVYKDNGFKLKQPPFHRIKQWIHRISYKIFINRENKKNV